MPVRQTLDVRHAGTAELDFCFLPVMLNDFQSFFERLSESGRKITFLDVHEPDGLVCKTKSRTRL
jgi:hypothetical protein